MTSPLVLFVFVIELLLAVACSSETTVGYADEAQAPPEVSAPEPEPAMPSGAGEGSGFRAPDPEPASGPPVPLGECRGPAGRTLRTLVVGNSQIYYWDLPSILAGLSTTAPPSCPRIAAESFTRGGQNLRRLWEGGDSEGRNLAETIRTGDYDVVLISESIDLLELSPPFEQYVTFATKIIDAARASGARPVLYATPYPNQPNHWGFVEMAAPQLALGRARGVTVAAGGLAWLRVWEEMPSIFLHHSDHSHPGYKGSVVSSMVIYAAITGATPIGLTPPAIDFRGESSPELTAEELDAFQRAAWAEARATALEAP